MTYMWFWFAAAACIIHCSSLLAQAINTENVSSTASQVCPVPPSNYGYWNRAEKQYQTDQPSNASDIKAPANDVCTVCFPVALPICSCPPGYVCAQDDNYPQCELCPAGYYCPRAGMSKALLCPKGTFCQEGAWETASCSGLSYCPEGSSRYHNLGILLWIAAGLGLAALLPRYAKACRIVGTAPNNLTMRRLGTLRKVQVTPVISLRQGAMPVNLHFDHVGYRLPTPNFFTRRFRPAPKTLIQSASGHVHSGEMLAIMGPSGAGKTTMLQLLRGRLKPTNGTVSVNGRSTKDSHVAQRVGYVPQDDIMLADLTVEEILLHSAHSRLASTWSAKERCQRVDSVIQVLGLHEARHRVVGDAMRQGISGGQRKRVNIGMELVADCGLLFMDEPTSGLDSSSSRELMECLCGIRDQGMAIAAVIHQPRSQIYEMFNNVLLLSPGGWQAYFGKPECAASHFASLGLDVNTEVCWPDYCMDLLSSVPVETFRQAPGGTGSCNRGCMLENPANKTAGSQAAVLKQVALYVHQNLLQWAHHNKRLLLNMSLYLLTGLYVGLGFTQQRYRLPLPSSLGDECVLGLAQLGYSVTRETIEDTATHDWCSTVMPAKDQIGQMAMYMGMGLGVISTAMAVPTLGGRVSLVQKREKTGGCSTFAFFAGRCLTDCMLIVFYTGMFVSTFTLVAVPTGSYSNLYALVYTLLCCMFGLGYVNAACLDYASANLGAVVGGIVWMITSGFVFKTSKMGLFGYFSFPRWFGEGIFASEMRPLLTASKQAGESAVNNVKQYADLRYGYKIERIGIDILITIILAFVLWFAAWRALNHHKAL